MLSTELQGVPLFERLGKKDIAVIAQLADEVDVSAGKVLAREGSFGHEFFVVRSGTAEVTRDGEHVADLGPGDFFGEMALVQDDRRNATVVASTDMSLIVLTSSGFGTLKHRVPAVHAAVVEQIAKRRPVSAA